MGAKYILTHAIANMPYTLTYATLEFNNIQAYLYMRYTHAISRKSKWYLANILDMG